MVSRSRPVCRDISEIDKSVASKPRRRMRSSADKADPLPGLYLMAIAIRQLLGLAFLLKLQRFSVGQ
jgi:hypothetical protein